jgi:hypothetical protein
MAVFVAVLLVYANGMAFNLFSTPSNVNDIIAFSALGVAVAFTLITLTVIFKDVRRKRSGLGEKLPVTAAPKPQEASVKTPSAIASLQAIKVQKSQEKIEKELSEHDDQLFKTLKAKPIKLICPACRKHFEPPAYIEDYIVDFGPQKPSNAFTDCPKCGTTIALKKKGASEEVEK